MNRSLLAILRTQCLYRQDQWDRFIQKAAFAHNCTRQSSTKCTPNSLFVGGDKNTPIGNIFPDFSPEFQKSPHELVRTHQKVSQQYLKIARANTKQSQQRQKRYFDAKIRKAYTYKVGDWVMAFIPVIPRHDKKKTTRLW